MPFSKKSGWNLYVADKAGVAHPCWANGVVVGDYSNDAWPDLLVTCFGGVVLDRNNGQETFTDVTKVEIVCHQEKSKRERISRRIVFTASKRVRAWFLCQHPTHDRTELEGIGSEPNLVLER